MISISNTPKTYEPTNEHTNSPNVLRANPTCPSIDTHRNFNRL